MLMIAIAMTASAVVSIMIGYVPTPMALGEVYAALQQGTIDGLENPLPVLLNGAYQEVAKAAGKQRPVTQRDFRAV